MSVKYKYPLSFSSGVTLKENKNSSREYDYCETIFFTLLKDDVRSGSYFLSIFKEIKFINSDFIYDEYYNIYLTLVDNLSANIRKVTFKRNKESKYYFLDSACNYNIRHNFILFVKKIKKNIIGELNISSVVLNIFKLIASLSMEEIMKTEKVYDTIIITNFPECSYIKFQITDPHHAEDSTKKNLLLDEEEELEEEDELEDEEEH
jgi:hypothetical protein